MTANNRMSTVSAPILSLWLKGALIPGDDTGRSCYTSMSNFGPKGRGLPPDTLNFENL